MQETHTIRIRGTTGLSWQRWFTAMEIYADDRARTRVHLLDPQTIGNRYPKSMCIGTSLMDEHRSMLQGPKKQKLCAHCAKRARAESDEFDDVFDSRSGYYGGW